MKSFAMTLVVLAMAASAANAEFTVRFVSSDEPTLAAPGEGDLEINTDDKDGKKDKKKDEAKRDAGKKEEKKPEPKKEENKPQLRRDVPPAPMPPNGDEAPKPYDLKEEAAPAADCQAIDGMIESCCQGFEGDCCSNAWAGYCNERGCGRKAHFRGMRGFDSCGCAAPVEYAPTCCDVSNACCSNVWDGYCQPKHGCKTKCRAPKCFQPACEEAPACDTGCDAGCGKKAYRPKFLHGLKACFAPVCNEAGCEEPACGCDSGVEASESEQPKAAPAPTHSQEKDPAPKPPKDRSVRGLLPGVLPMLLAN